MVVHSAADLLPRALVIGVEHALAIYDSIYIAMSEILKHPLITVDVRQSEAAKKVGILLKPITDFAEYKP